MPIVDGEYVAEPDRGSESLVKSVNKALRESSEVGGSIGRMLLENKINEVLGVTPNEAEVVERQNKSRSERV